MVLEGLFGDGTAMALLILQGSTARLQLFMKKQVSQNSVYFTSSEDCILLLSLCVGLFRSLKDAYNDLANKISVIQRM